jgi:putative transposase
MNEYRKGSQTIYSLKYHLVWITKYRKKVLTGSTAERVRELIRQICKANDVEILKGHVSKDHIRLFVSVPPQISVSKLVQHLKGKTSMKLQQEFKPL